MIIGDDFTAVGDGIDCGVEPTAVRWRRSRYSSGAGSSCVEVARGLSEVWVRDSKDLHGWMLVFSVEEWRTLVRGVRAGEFGC